MQQGAGHAGRSATVHELPRNTAAGDPVADYVAMWLALELFHSSRRLTPEGWAFLTEQLQRPLELRLLEREPRSTEGALKALRMASHIMANLDSGDTPEAAWYRRLRQHLIDSARNCLERLLESDESGSGGATAGPRAATGGHGVRGETAWPERATR